MVLPSAIFPIRLVTDNAMAIIAHADAGDYDPIDARADEYTQHHLGDITA